METRMFSSLWKQVCIIQWSYTIYLFRDPIGPFIFSSFFCCLQKVSHQYNTYLYVYRSTVVPWKLNEERKWRQKCVEITRCHRTHGTIRSNYKTNESRSLNMFPSFFFHDDLFIYIYSIRNLYYRTHGRVLWYRDS